MAGSVTANRAETAGNRLRTILENAAQFVRVLAVKAAGGFHRRIGFAAEGIAFNTRIDIDRFELHRAGGVLRNTARQRFRAKICAEIGERAKGSTDDVGGIKAGDNAPPTGEIAAQEFEAYRTKKEPRIAVSLMLQGFKRGQRLRTQKMLFLRLKADQKRWLAKWQATI